MKLKEIKYKKRALSGEIPDSITVVLSIKETAYLAKMLGELTSNDSNKIMPGGSELNSPLYRGLSVVFNMNWENGLYGYLRGDTE